MADPTEAEMMSDLQAADAAGDSDLAQHIAGRIKLHRATPDKPIMEDVLRNLPESQKPYHSGFLAGGKAESLVRGALQGATAGFGDELSGAIAAALPFTDREAAGAGDTYGERYRHARDFYRAKNDTAKQANSKTFLAGEIGGSLLPASRIAKVLPAAEGAGLSARAAASATQGGLFGSLAGAGNSRASSTPGVLEDTATGGLTGSAIGASVPFATWLASQTAQPVASYLGDKAVSLGRKVLSGVKSPLSARAPLPASAVQEALDSGAIVPLGTTKGAASRLSASADSLGEQQDAIIEELASKGVRGPNAVKLAQDIAARAQDAEKTSLGSARPGMLRDAADELPSKVSGAPFADKTLPLDQATKIKQGLQSEARREYDKISRQYTTAGETKKELAAIVRQAIDDAVTAQSDKAPEAAAQFLPVKEKLANTMRALTAAEEGSARAARRKGLGLADTIVGSAVGAASKSPLLGIVSALGHHAIDQRLPSTLAWGANKGAQLLSKVPATVPEEVSQVAVASQAGDPFLSWLRSRMSVGFSPAAADEEGQK